MYPATPPRRLRNVVRGSLALTLTSPPEPAGATAFDGEPAIGTMIMLHGGAEMTGRAIAMTGVVMLALGIPAVAAETHPRLCFSAQDLPTLRERAEAMPEVREAILSEAESLMGPDSIAPESLLELGADTRQQIRGHMIGRELTSRIETLGFAYQVTGDERFGVAGANLLETVRNLPPDEPPVGPHAFAGARGDILRAMVIGYDWLYDAMSEAQREIVAGMMARYVENLLAESPDAWWMPYHNFIGVAIGACGTASIALEERFPERAAAWRKQSLYLVEEWLSSGFDREGAYLEGVGYSFYGLGNATLFMDALKRAGGPNLFAHPHLQRYPHFLAQSLLPGESVFDARNDSGYTNGATPVLLRLSAEGLPLAKWLWQNTGGVSRRDPWRIIWANDVEGQSPVQADEPLSAHFPGRGLVVFRTGWDADDLMFSVEAGEYFPIVHNQADKGHFTLYGQGGWWAIDSGYGNNREPEGKAQTVAHNCVLIDGRGQALTGASWGTDGAILNYRALDTVGYALADATAAYRENNRGHVGVPLERAHRHCFFVRPADGAPGYAIIVDDILVDGAEHQYDWLLHSGSRNRVTLEEAGATMQAMAAASGGAYVVTPADTTGAGEAVFEFTAETAGNYHVWARVRAGGEQAGKSDSFRVSMNGLEPVDWHMSIGGDWVWREVHELLADRPTTFALEPGPHRLHIATREREAQIDALFITPREDLAPAAASPEEAIFFEAEDAAAIKAPMTVRQDPVGEGAKCVLRFAWPPSPALSLDDYEDHPRLHASNRMVEGRFAAVLVPLVDAADPPRVSGSDGRLTVDFGGVEDTLEVRHSAETPAAWRLMRTVDGEQRWETSSEHPE